MLYHQDLRQHVCLGFRERIKKEKYKDTNRKIRVYKNNTLGYNITQGCLRRRGKLLQWRTRLMMRTLTHVHFTVRITLKNAKIRNEGGHKHVKNREIHTKKCVREFQCHTFYTQQCAHVAIRDLVMLVLPGAI